MPDQGKWLRSVIQGFFNHHAVPGNRDALDAGLFILHTPSGSGTFYYVAAALNRNGNYRGTNGVLLGDRIAPQTIQISNGVVVANYADR